MKRAKKTKGLIVEKRSISASPELWAEADKVAAARYITNFSEYVRSLISRDLRGEFGAPKQAA